MSEQKLVEVYRAKDSPHAHLLKSALEDAGIGAVIDSSFA
jgi:Putative prokaryotic signal transducing protein